MLWTARTVMPTAFLILYTRHGRIALLHVRKMQILTAGRCMQVHATRTRYNAVECKGMMGRVIATG